MHVKYNRICNDFILELKALTIITQNITYSYLISSKLLIKIQYHIIYEEEIDPRT